MEEITYGRTHTPIDQGGRTLIDRDAGTDAVLPEQFFTRAGTGAADVPEKRLMFAVLLDAVVHLRRGDPKTAVEAERWIRKGNADDSPFSFHNICDALGFDPGYLARGLLRWRTSARTREGMPSRQLRAVHGRIRPARQRGQRLAVAQ